MAKSNLPELSILAQQKVVFMDYPPKRFFALKKLNKKTLTL